MVCAVGLVACGDDEPKSSDPTTTSTTEAPTTETSTLGTVSAVLASRLRGEFPGVRDTEVTVDGDHLRIHFEVGEGEVPGSEPLDFALLAAQELQTIAPEVVDRIDDVTVHIEGIDAPVEETFVLHGELLPAR